VVTDDNFASIVAAVEEGRGIYDNIQKFIHYLLSCNSGEILVMFVAALVGMPVPLFAIQILWVNLVTDGLPALALGFDPTAPNIMKRPPRRTDEAVITRPRAMAILGQGAVIAACSLAAFSLLSAGGHTLGRARTGAFFVLSSAQLFHAFNCRSPRESLFALGLRSNMKLVGAVLISFSLQVLVVYAPFLQRIFKTETLHPADLLEVLALSSLPLWTMELIKAAGRRRSRGAHAHT